MKRDLLSVTTNVIVYLRGVFPACIVEMASNFNRVNGIGENRTIGFNVGQGLATIEHWLFAIEIIEEYKISYNVS